MKNSKKIGACLLAAFMLYTLTGCSFAESWDLLWGSHESSAMTAEEIHQMKAEKVVRPVDETMEAPVFGVDLGQVATYQVGANAETLMVDATAGSGAVSYQWYNNNAASNGGGEPIEGATETTYTPSTAEAGTFYYFCVATSTQDGRIRMSTSQLATVIVEDEEEMSVLQAEEMEEGEGGQE